MYKNNKIRVYTNNKRTTNRQSKQAEQTGRAISHSEPKPVGGGYGKESGEQVKEQKQNRESLGRTKNRG